MGDLPPFELNRIDALFGQIAVGRHFVAPHHVRECMDELVRQAAKNPDLRLADILVRKGYLTRSQRETVDGLATKQLAPQRIGRYELLAKIGEGGMGTVYKAKDSSGGRIVALKVVLPEMIKDKTFMGRFQREAMALTRMEHPNIVRGIDVGAVENAHYIAMEFIDGTDCDRMLMRRGRIPEREALQIVVQVANALQYAHSKRLVHRDIKPANILVTSDGTAKLTDLGLAKSTSATASKLTQTGITMGTPHYISPEQAMGSRDLDFRSDIYSLGATLYHLVTGRVPFEGSSPAVIVAKHLTEELVNPRDLVPELTDGLVAVLEKMMAKDRDDRYQDPVKLIDDLQRVIDGKPPEGELEPGKSAIMKSADFRAAAAAYRAKKLKTSGKNRSLMMAVIGAGLMLGVVLTVVGLVVRSKPDMLRDFRDFARDTHHNDIPAGWFPLFTGTDLVGWRAVGEGGVTVRSGEYTFSGPVALVSDGAAKDFILSFEARPSNSGSAWLVLNRPTGSSAGGYRIRLPATAEDRWTTIVATVRGVNVTVMAGGEEYLAPEVESVSPSGTIGLEVDDGTLKIRRARHKPIYLGSPET